MPRPLPAALLVVLVLAGCTGGGGGKADLGSDEGFGDLGVAPTATTGVLLGVVVDGAIRPIADATVAVTGTGLAREAATDAEGRFALGDLQPGTYFIQASHPLHKPAQTSAEVVAGEQDPPIVRIQLERLFSQDPYSTALKVDGFIACGFNAGTTAPCITDYTQVLPPCGGGCVPQLRKAQGDKRDYTTTVDAGWQQIVVELTFEPSSQASSDSMGFVVSHNNRTGAAHSFGGAQGTSPVRWQADVGVEADGAASQEPTMIPAEGWGDLLVFFNIRADSSAPAAVTVNQQYSAFHHTFYYGKAPDGWSFVNGDPLPF